MRVLVIAAATLVVAACQVAEDPKVKGATYVGPCSTNSSYYIVQLPRTNERVISGYVEPVNESQITHVAPGVDPFLACQSRPFMNSNRYHNH